MYVCMYVCMCIFLWPFAFVVLKMQEFLPFMLLQTVDNRILIALQIAKLILEQVFGQLYFP